MLPISRLEQLSGNERKFLMTITRKNAFALTVYCAFISALIFILNQVFPNTQSLSLNNLTDIGKYSSWLSMGIIGILTFWLFFAGLAVLAVYKFFLSHRHHLKKPRNKFINFYFVFILWIALFLSFDFLMLIIALNVDISVLPAFALILNLILTFLIDGAALIFMYCYLGGHIKIYGWFKRLIKGKEKYTIKQLIAWGVLFYIALYPILILTAGLNGFILKLTGRDFSLQSVVEFSLQNTSLAAGILLFVSAAFIAPFFEEIIMRGLLFRGLTLKMAVWKAALLSGLIFASFHFNIFSFLPIAVLGALFAWIYSRTGSLIPSIIAHALFNGVNFMLIGLLK
jgi:membrane protease YdiL (CAAX protease family)